MSIAGEPVTDPGPAPTDTELLARLATGDAQAYTELVARYQPQLLRYARTFVSRRDLAEDVVQETWLATWRGLNRFEGRSALRTWLFAICANQARTIATRERRTVPVDLTTVAPDFAPDSAWLARADSWANAAREHQADAALVTRVRTAISQLPPAQRQVVTLRDVEGLSPRQVCEVLSISPTNQRVLLHRGRAGVRSRQQPTGR